MSALLYSLLRVATQLGGGAVFAWLAAQSIDVKTGDNGTLVSTLATAGLMFAWITVARFLESRKGDGVMASAARALGAVMTLGLTRQPVYPTQYASAAQRGYSGRNGPA